MADPPRTTTPMARRPSRRDRVLPAVRIRILQEQAAQQQAVLDEHRMSLSLRESAEYLDAQMEAGPPPAASAAHRHHQQQQQQQQRQQRQQQQQGQQRQGTQRGQTVHSTGRAGRARTPSKPAKSPAAKPTKPTKPTKPPPTASAAASAPAAAASASASAPAAKPSKPPKMAKPTPSAPSPSAPAKPPKRAKPSVHPPPPGLRVPPLASSSVHTLGSPSTGGPEGAYVSAFDAADFEELDNALEEGSARCTSGERAADDGLVGLRRARTMDSTTQRPGKRPGASGGAKIPPKKPSKAAKPALPMPVLPPGVKLDDDDDLDELEDDAADGADPGVDLASSVRQSMALNPYFVVPGVDPGPAIPPRNVVVPVSPPPEKADSERGPPPAAWLRSKIAAALDEEFVSLAEMRRRRSYADEVFAMLSPPGLSKRDMRKRAQLRKKVAKDPDRYFAKLLYAIEKGNVSKVAMYISCGVRVSQKLPDGWTALHTAAACNRAEILKMLLNVGNTLISMDLATSEGLTPLHVAARDNAPDAARVLIGHGASILEDRADRIPHDFAVKERNGAVLEVLLDATEVFGRELDRCSERDHSMVPAVIRDTIQWFLADPERLRVEGVFRKSARKASLNVVRALYDRGHGDIDLGRLVAQLGDEVNTVAHSLKMYIGELPTPIIPQAQYEAAGQLGTQVLSFGLDSEPTDWPQEEADAKLADSKALTAAVSGLLLAEMEVVHLRVLWTLLLFLRLASLPDYAADSRMGVSNLALVMAPNVIRSPGIDALTELQMTKPLNALMMFMIINVADLDFTPRS